MARNKPQPFRLDSGGRINRDRPLSFVFNRRAYRGYEGDTAASALLANGVHLVGRSFKYHRPRGIVGAGLEEPKRAATGRHGSTHHTQPPGHGGATLRWHGHEERQLLAQCES